jgi:HEAT repeat protein
MTCHWREGTDYSRFQGGAECKTAFDPRVGSVEACASCHRNHGTPYQWEASPNGKIAGNLCIDCHMPLVERPPAVGEAPRSVHSHVFPASRSLSQLRRAYDYEAKIEGNEVVVKITNKGAGHNFPTELKQRAVESLVVVRDASGQEIARSRMVFRDPYKRPYGLTLPVNTQIPSGEFREHRVPIGVADGTAECELHYKLYYPIEDDHPDLARRLETQTLVFSGLEPSTRVVEEEPEVKIVTPEGIAPEQAGPANLVDYAHPPIGKVDVEIPAGNTQADIDHLIELFQFPVLQANAEARTRLTEIGAPAVPALVKAMGSWDNKTFNQSMTVLEQIGEPAVEQVVAALGSEELYLRLHAAEMLPRLSVPAASVGPQLIASLARPNALDRSHAALAIGACNVAEGIPHLRRRLLEDSDPDVVRAAARSLAQMGAKDAVADLRTALDRFEWPETRREIAEALARLGDATGIPVLLAGLDLPDDLTRESYFEVFFSVTGKHYCYDPLGPRDERLEALSKLTAWWAEEGGPSALRTPRNIDRKIAAEVRKIADQIGGSDGSLPPGDDVKLRARLIEIGADSVPGLSLFGLKYAPGFSEKRALICGVLGEIRDPSAVPTLVATLRDPVVAVAAWACDSLARIGDTAALPAIERYHHRLLSLASQGRIPESAGSSANLIAQAIAAQFALGDDRVATELIGMLLSEDPAACRTAFTALANAHPELHYDPDASPEERREAVERWQGTR